MTPFSGSGLATCLSCHTPHASLTFEAVHAGDDWQCARCGQHWDAGRLAIVAAYDEWAAEYVTIAKAAAR